MVSTRMKLLVEEEKRLKRLGKMESLESTVMMTSKRTTLLEGEEKKLRINNRQEGMAVWESIAEMISRKMTEVVAGRNRQPSNNDQEMTEDSVSIAMKILKRMKAVEGRRENPKKLQRKDAIQAA